MLNLEPSTSRAFRPKHSSLSAPQRILKQKSSTYSSRAKAESNRAQGSSKSLGVQGLGLRAEEQKEKHRVLGMLRQTLASLCNLTPVRIMAAVKSPVLVHRMRQEPEQRHFHLHGISLLPLCIPGVHRSGEATIPKLHITSVASYESLVNPTNKVMGPNSRALMGCIWASIISSRLHL